MSNSVSTGVRSTKETNSFRSNFKVSYWIVNCYLFRTQSSSQPRTHYKLCILSLPSLCKDVRFRLIMPTMLSFLLGNRKVNFMQLIASRVDVHLNLTAANSLWCVLCKYWIRMFKFGLLEISDSYFWTVFVKELKSSEFFATFFLQVSRNRHD